MRAFSAVSSAVAAAAFLASSVLADVDPIVIKVLASGRLGGILLTRKSGLQILLQDKRDGIVSLWVFPTCLICR